MTDVAQREVQVAVVDDHEKPARRLARAPGLLVSVVAGAASVYALWWVFNPQALLEYRVTFLLLVLPLVFLSYRWRPRAGSEPEWPSVLDWLLAALSAAVLVYPLLDIDAFINRSAAPSAMDMTGGIVLALLLLEAVRRTVGWIMSAICVVFFAYAYWGEYLPIDWAIGHRPFAMEDIIAGFYMGGEGFFGTAFGVAATYIVLFAIYGAVLEYSGASQFFLDISFAAFRRSNAAAGRTVTSAGFLLGTVSGSGVATTVSVAGVAWPMLKRAGYPPDHAGGVLAAAGIGAILSPPTLGAAAFIIAELLEVSYLTVLLYATIPTLLYYLGVLLAIEIDARRFGMRTVQIESPSVGRLFLRFGYHFSSLFVVIVLMAIGRSAFQAVAYATLLAFLLSFLDREHRMGPKRLGQALAKGVQDMLPVAAVCAAAGIITGTVVLTGLGTQVSGMIVDLGSGILLPTVVLAAVAVLLLGLAVPVTVSFIIGAVIIGPALISLGVEPAEAYMFIFYYSVLSEVSPPTALAAMAASTITGGSPMRTMWLTWRYTLPAFLVPFAFVLTPNGSALLAQGPILQILAYTGVSAIAVVALGVAVGGLASIPVRLLAGLAAVLLLFLEIGPITGGLAALAAAGIVHVITGRRSA